jgi:glyoxylase-like metal-dependent hydrolase (beta-lactamase superfamily II)
MKIEKLIDSLNDTNTYIVYDEKEKNCIIFDPCNFNIVNEFIFKNNLQIGFIILTHEHFDHILGVNKLIDKYKCDLVASEECNGRITNSKSNLSSFSEVLFYFKNYNARKLPNQIKKIDPYICRTANIKFENSKKIKWNSHDIYMYETPGHSKGSITIIIDNEYLFSGDSMLKDMEVITRFPGGSTKDYNNITLPFYKSLDFNLIVYPGHGQSFVLKEKFKIEEN